jgi:hypothetical protein
MRRSFRWDNQSEDIHLNPNFVSSFWTRQIDLKNLLSRPSAGSTGVHSVLFIQWTFIRDAILHKSLSQTHQLFIVDSAFR